MTIAARPPDDALEGAAVEDVSNARTDRAVGRLHNRENPSPAEMAEMLREVQDTLAALDERLEGLEGAQGDSSVVTRRLASSVAEMGETLVRRVRLLESGDAAPRPAASAPQLSAPPPPLPAAPVSRPAPAGWKKVGRVDTWVLILGVIALAVLVAIGLWVFWRQIAGGASPAKPAAVAAAPAAALAPPPAPAPTPTVQAAAPRTTAAPTRHLFYPTRHTYVRQAAPTQAAVPADQTPATAAFRSFGPAPTNSVPKPSS